MRLPPLRPEKGRLALKGGHGRETAFHWNGAARLQSLS